MPPSLTDLPERQQEGGVRRQLPQTAASVHLGFPKHPCRELGFHRSGWAGAGGGALPRGHLGDRQGLHVLDGTTGRTLCLATLAR